MFFIILNILIFCIVIGILYLFAPLFLSSKNFQILSASSRNNNTNLEEACYPSPISENAGIVTTGTSNNSYIYKPFGSINESPTKELSVIVPAYNENERIVKMLTETINYLFDRMKKNPLFSFEIIVVDDGSKDNTAEIVLTFVNKHGSDIIRLLKLKKNRGKGGAIQRGITIFLFVRFIDLKRLELL